MLCPYCGHPDQKVLETRAGIDGESIRRRRECMACARRFTTHERAEVPHLYVVKRNGGRQEFQAEKVLSSMRLACQKRPVRIDILRSAVDRLERDLAHEFGEEVPTKEIGRRVMRELASIDTVAYVRFASVYEEFETVSDFAQIVDKVQTEEALRPFSSLQETLL